MNKQDIENKLERLLDSFREWKQIYGAVVPDGYAEPKDRAKERKRFQQDIAALRQQLKGAL
jgi:hypothetical protein